MKRVFLNAFCIFFFCCFPLCSRLRADNELTDVLGSPASGPWPQPQGGPCRLQLHVLQPRGPPQPAHRSRQGLASPSTHTWDTSAMFWPLNTQRGEKGFPWVCRERGDPSSLRAGWLPRAFGQGAWLVAGTQAHSPGWAFSPPILPARDMEASEEKLKDCLHPSVTFEEEPCRGREGRESELRPPTLHTATATLFWCKEKMLDNSDLFKCFKFLHSESVVFSTLTRGLVTDCRSGDGLSKPCN